MMSPPKSVCPPEEKDASLPISIALFLPLPLPLPLLPLKKKEKKKKHCFPQPPRSEPKLLHSFRSPSWFLCPSHWSRFRSFFLPTPVPEFLLEPKWTTFPSSPPLVRKSKMKSESHTGRGIRRWNRIFVRYFDSRTLKQFFYGDNIHDAIVHSYCRKCHHLFISEENRCPGMCRELSERK